jgi:hypothetical protein
MPPFVTLCVEGKYPFYIDSFISPTINMVLKFPTTDVGFLCASPETTYKNALLATQLCSKGSTKGIIFEVLISQILGLKLILNSTGLVLNPTSILMKTGKFLSFSIKNSFHKTKNHVVL